MQAQKIGLGPPRRRGDPGGRPFAQHIGDIAHPLDRGLSLVEVRLAAVTDMHVVAGEPAHHAEELVIAALQRAVARQIPEMPFADQRRAIAGVAQQRRQCGEPGRHPHLRRFAVAPAQRLDQPDRQAGTDSGR